MSTTQHTRIAATATFVTNLVACVRISGDVDAAAADEIARVMTHLYMRRCRTVYIDLADVTFAHTLSSFIAAVYLIDTTRTSVILCRRSVSNRPGVRSARAG